MREYRVPNSVEFTYADTPFTIFCKIVRDTSVVSVSNFGPYLPEEMKGRRVDSMSSVRPQEKQKQPHLGIGLHIARLVTEFHQGQIRAENLRDVEGVAITMAITLLEE